jgi:hypothetical protein
MKGRKKYSFLDAITIPNKMVFSFSFQTWKIEKVIQVTTGPIMKKMYKLKMYINFKTHLTISITKDSKYKGGKRTVKIRLLTHLKPFDKKHSIFMGQSPL